MNPLCTPEHTARLSALYERDEAGDKIFGRIGYLWADRVAALVKQTESDSLLDYGCGRSNLLPAVVEKLHTMGYSLQHRHEYDPAFGHMPPEPADFVTCIDVLEHVESDLLIPVMQDIRRCMRKMALITVSLRWASFKKRDVHPNVYPREWWLTQSQYNIGRTTEIEILDPTKAKSEVAMLVEPYEKADL